MSEQIKHECGIAFLRLRKPLEYYINKYGSAFYGLNKMHILMEKQHNRGQDGAGLAAVKLDPCPGSKYIDRVRSNSDKPIMDIFEEIHERIEKSVIGHGAADKCEWLKSNVPFCSEVYLGHLRYGTFGRNDIENVHPVMRESNWMTKNLVIAGNFNLTNIDELFDRMVGLGQYPSATTDTVTVLERIGHFLDCENEEKYRYYRDKGYTKQEVTSLIRDNMDVGEVLSRAARHWDGGYVMAGLLGHGDAFIMRDPNGIRPAFYYIDEEVVVTTSERAVIQTTFNAEYDDVIELAPANALIVKYNGEVSTIPFIEEKEYRPCSFERIYFSRGSDRDIYKERKRLGKRLIPQLMDSIDGDIENTVFSYIPNTAESAFFGIMEGLEEYCDNIKAKKLEYSDRLDVDKIKEVLKFRPRVEKVAVKDVKMRTFITQDNWRDDLVAHVYDVTYGTVKPGTDNLVIVDDSIVRGTTLKHSIIRILDRLEPKKIVICSSAPQIRYPDCYGIDMSRLGDFVAFRAAIELLRESGKEEVIEEVYWKCKASLGRPKEVVTNCVKEIYEGFTDEEISARIARIVKAEDIKAEVEVVYQTVEGLHEAIPIYNGDWYFTGNYPTPGGNVVVNRAFVNYYENNNDRAY